jgi:hypothetical protein
VTIDLPAVALTGRRWLILSYAYAALVVCALGYFLIDLPIQVSDSYGNLVQASGGTLGSLVSGQFRSHGFLRPLLWAHIRVLADVSGGHYFEWFRGWHVAQVALLAVLFLRLVRPDRPFEAAAVPVGLAALVGIHTFAGTIREAFPINAYMTIVLCCVIAADLALGAPRWWRDVAAVVVFVFASLTAESGLLVAVIFVAAYAAGARGVSGRGVAAVVACVAAYFLLRFVILDVGTPELTERSSGFGFSRREPSELAAMFGGSPLPFYVYNVIASALSVLVSEPRGGTWIATRGFVESDARMVSSLNVVASLLGTLAMAMYIWRRRSDWLARRFDRGDRLMIVFAAVLAANAAISYTYTKDVILSPAGVFYAVALTIATASLVASAASATRRRFGVMVFLLLLSTTWGLRAIGAHIGLRKAAVATRNEWALIDQWLERERQTPASPQAAALKRQLEDDAIWRHPARPAVTGEWIERLFDDQ